MSIYIKNTTVITINEKKDILHNTGVLIEDNEIADIGPDDELYSKNYKADTIIDGGGKIVLPGFVSAHNHLGYTVFRGMAEDIGSAPTPSLYLPMKEVITPQERRVIGSLAAAELVKSGVTTILEMEEDVDVIAPFIEGVGLRAIIALMTNDVDIASLYRKKIAFSAKNRDQCLRQSRDIVKHWSKKRNERISVFMAANMLLTCSAELLRGLRRIADQYHSGLTLHIGLGAYEKDLIRSSYGQTPFEFASDNGFLTEDTLAVHCHSLCESDMKLLSRSGAHVAHCPQLNALRAVAAPVLSFRQMGINVGLGLDNYFSDFFELMRCCIYVSRLRENDSLVSPAYDVLEMGTMGSARALKLDKKIGSIEVGKLADLQILDLQTSGSSPVTDPVRSIVYHANPGNIVTVIIDGKIVVKDGELLTANMSQLVSEASCSSQNAWKRFYEKYGDVSRR